MDTMKANRKAVLGGLTLFVLAALALAQENPSHNSKTNAPSATNAPPAVTSTNRQAGAGFPIIGYLERRGQTITIKAGPKGPVYDVRTAKGKVLFENVSAEQLRAKAPELNEFLKGAVSGRAGKGVVVDASVRPDRTP
jgi:hypothetical protein